MVKLSRRELALGAVAAALVAAWLALRGGGTRLPVGRPAGPTAPTAAVEDVPRIDLARLKQPAREGEAGRRDLFAYGAAPGRGDQRVTDVLPTPPPAAARTPPPAEAATTAQAAGPPPFNVKYVGSVESKQGVRAAILLTDKKEILVGQQGDVVANRLRIVKIGYESVDVQDVGSEHVRRIPFKGN
jgi:hypothetical protein